MILFDTDILSARQSGAIVIDPFNPEHLGPNSYDVTLAPRLLCYSLVNYDVSYSFVHSDVTLAPRPLPPLDMRKENRTYDVAIPDEGLVLYPGRLYLGETVEVIGARAKYVPIIEGRSSVGRLGISVHVTAGFGDVGYVGRWTLEITVVHPVRVYAGVRIAQAYFLQGKGTPAQKYRDSKNYAADGLAASRMHRDGRMLVLDNHSIIEFRNDGTPLWKLAQEMSDDG